MFGLKFFSFSLIMFILATSLILSLANPIPTPDDEFGKFHVFILKNYIEYSIHNIHIIKIVHYSCIYAMEVS